MKQGDIFEDGGRRLVVDEVISPTRYLSHVMTAEEEAKKAAEEAEKAADKKAAEKAAKKEASEAEKRAAEEAEKAGK